MTDGAKRVFSDPFLVRPGTIALQTRQMADETALSDELISFQHLIITSQWNLK